jgi:hypothetical protein
LFTGRSSPGVYLRLATAAGAARIILFNAFVALDAIVVFFVSSMLPAFFGS